MRVESKTNSQFIVGFASALLLIAASALVLQAQKWSKTLMPSPATRKLAMLVRLLETLCRDSISESET